MTSAATSPRGRSDGACQPELVTDVVEGGAEPVRRRTRVLLVALLAISLVAVGADRWRADRERERLREAVLAGEQTVSASSRSLAGVAAYSSRLLTGGDVRPEARRSAYAVLGDDARRWTARVERAQSRVAAVDVLPWHTGVQEARDAYDLRLQAWADALERFADDPRTGVVDPAVTRSRTAADEALSRAGLDLLD